jgi:hypothetical protein
MFKLTENNPNVHAYINKDNKGYVLGGPAKTIPQEFKGQHTNKKMAVHPVCEFKRVIDRTNTANLKCMKPAFARVTQAGTLIIE